QVLCLCDNIYWHIHCYRSWGSAIGRFPELVSLHTFSIILYPKPRSTSLKRPIFFQWLWSSVLHFGCIAYIDIHLCKFISIAGSKYSVNIIGQTETSVFYGIYRIDESTNLAVYSFILSPLSG